MIASPSTALTMASSDPAPEKVETEVEMTQLESTINNIQIEASAMQTEMQEGAQLPYIPPSRPERSVSFGPATSYSESGGYVRPLRSFSSYPSAAAQSTLGEEEIALVEDVDIEMSIPSRLIGMEFPKADDGHEEDVAKVIRKSFSKMGLRHGDQDAISVLSKTSLSLGHISLMSDVEEAVDGEEPGDHFWETVRFNSYLAVEVASFVVNIRGGNPGALSIMPA